MHVQAPVRPARRLDRRAGAVVCAAVPAREAIVAAKPLVRHVSLTVTPFASLKLSFRTLSALPGSGLGVGRNDVLETCGAQGPIPLQKRTFVIQYSAT